MQYQVQADVEGVTLILLHTRADEVLELLPVAEGLLLTRRSNDDIVPQQRLSVHRFEHPKLYNRASFDLAIYSVSAFKSKALRLASPLECVCIKS